MYPRPIYICAAQRTAIGSLSGSLASQSAVQLGSHVIKAVLAQSKVPAETIQEVLMGCVLTAGTGQAPTRQALIGAGVPLHVQATTINKVCSSGLKAVMLAAQSVALGDSEAVIAGGMESMTNAPYLLPALRGGARLGNTTAEDSIIKDGLWDPYGNFHMGNAAELCAREFSLSRKDQDDFAIESYARATRAIADGSFKDEIAPIEVSLGREKLLFQTDEEPGKAKPDKIPTLKPVFQKDGTVTAANASSINDGAAALLVCSEEYATKHNLTPLVRIVATAAFGQAPEWFTTAPVGAVEQLLQRTKKSISQIDLFEINEAFSAVALACSQKLQIDRSKLNIHGGAVALGHPIGASGARILTTLIYSLRRQKLTTGVAAICNGGGEATAMMVERV